jgi:hypothetical protein
MASKRSRLVVHGILIFLTVLDAVLAGVVFLSPETWFATIHGAPHVDPQGLLQRTGSIWLAFAVLQIAAIVRWQRAPWWLMLVAGARFAELFADWTWLLAAGDLTAFGRIALLVSTPLNLVFGLVLARTYLEDPRDLDPE